MAENESSGVVVRKKWSGKFVMRKNELVQTLRLVAKNAYRAGRLSNQGRSRVVLVMSESEQRTQETLNVRIMLNGEIFSTTEQSATITSSVNEVNEPLPRANSPQDGVVVEENEGFGDGEVVLPSISTQRRIQPPRKSKKKPTPTKRAKF